MLAGGSNVVIEGISGSNGQRPSAKWFLVVWAGQSLFYAT